VNVSQYCSGCMRIKARRVVQCSARQSIAVQCRVGQGSAGQCRVVQCSARQRIAVQCRAGQCSVGQVSAVQGRAVQCRAG
jgi:hypothetical protein